MNDYKHTNVTISEWITHNDSFGVTHGGNGTRTGFMLHELYTRSGGPTATTTGSRALTDHSTLSLFHTSRQTEITDSNGDSGDGGNSGGSGSGNNSGGGSGDWSSAYTVAIDADQVITETIVAGSQNESAITSDRDKLLTSYLLSSRDATIPEIKSKTIIEAPDGWYYFGGNGSNNGDNGSGDEGSGGGSSGNDDSGPGPGDFGSGYQHLHDNSRFGWTGSGSILSSMGVNLTLVHTPRPPGESNTFV